MESMLGSDSGVQVLKGRLPYVALFALAFILVLAGKLYYLQIEHGEEYYERSLGNFIKEARRPADRGMILDARHRILVDNRPSYNVTMTRAFCQGPQAPKGHCLGTVLPRLAELLSLTDDEVERVKRQYASHTGAKRYRDFLVKVDVDQDTIDRLEANQMDLDGVDVQIAAHRNYRFGSLAAHALGYMNEIKTDELRSRETNGDGSYQLGDYIGRSGVERLFEEELRGEAGMQKHATDSRGKSVPIADQWLPPEERDVPPVSGNNLVLSLDLDLQQEVEDAFAEQTAGAVVVVEARTGFILAIQSKPAFDPNELTGRISRKRMKEIADDELKPLLFRPVQSQYPPGSTWKPVTALAALRSQTVTAQTQHVCNGGYTLGRRTWRCWSAYGHGAVNLRNSLKHSCDVWYYAVSDKMGVEPIAEVGRLFGFGTRPGLKLSPEAAGIVPDIAYYNRTRKKEGGYQRGLALNASIGQGDVNASPLQLAMAYAAIGNGGTLYRPQIVRRVEKADGTLVKEMEPEVVRRLDIPSEDLAVVREGTWAVVNEVGGTAYGKRLKDVEVLGKTGTAQVVAIGSTRTKAKDMEYFSRDHAWFAAVAPAANPEVVVIVLSEHGGGGSSVAAPVAMKVMDSYFKLKWARADADRLDGTKQGKDALVP